MVSTGRAERMFAGQPESVGKKTNPRIDYLDGLRAAAILSVACFHYYRWWCKYGYYGVELFFCISGFVICLTLHNSRSHFHFFSKRFSRLFPTMLLCASATFFFSFIGPNTIYSSKITYFLPSLTFLEPKIFSLIFKNTHFAWMDGSYWSLFVEIRFYAIVAFIYFYNKNSFFLNYLTLSTSISVISFIFVFFRLNILVTLTNFLFFSEYECWFMFGVGCYYLYTHYNAKAYIMFIVSFTLNIIYSLPMLTHKSMSFENASNVFAMLIIGILLIMAITNKYIQRILSFKCLTTIGVASYSFYLLHQNIGLKCIKIIANLTGHFVAGLTVIVIMICCSLLIYNFYERPLNILLNNILGGRYVGDRFWKPVCKYCRQHVKWPDVDRAHKSQIPNRRN